MNITKFNWLQLRNAGRFSAVALILVAGYCMTFESKAQVTRARRIVSVQVSDFPRGARVTIVADLTLADYSASRRGDNFEVRIPYSEFASSQPRSSGNGFDAISIQRSGDGVLLSFKLQPGATARVDQSYNRLDVVFSSAANTLSDAAQTGMNNSSHKTLPTSLQTRARQAKSDSRSGASTVQTGDSPTTKSPGSFSATEQTPETRVESARVSNAAGASAEGAPVSAREPASESVAVGQRGTAETSLVPNSSVANEAPSQQVSEAKSQPEGTPTAIVRKPTSTQPMVMATNSFQSWFLANWRWLLPVGLLSGGLLVYLGIKLWRPRKRPELAPNRRSKGNRAVPTAVELLKKNNPQTSSAIDEEIVRVVATTPNPAREMADAHVAQPAIEEISQSTPDPVQTQSPEVKESIVDVPNPNQLEHLEVEIKKLLEGKPYDGDLIDTVDASARKVIAGGLLAALASRRFEQHEFARLAFIDLGYFDETTRTLKTGDSVLERSAAARKLGVLGDKRAVAHLVAALYDTAPDVRRAAVESLGQVGDSSALTPLAELLQRENSRQLPEAIIRHAINSISVTEVKRSTNERPALRVVEKSGQSASRESASSFNEFAESLKRDLRQSEPGVAKTSSVTHDAIEAPANPFEEQPEVAKQYSETRGDQLDQSKHDADESQILAELKAKVRAENERTLRDEEARVREAAAAEQLKLEEEARVREAAAAEQLKLEEEARAREAAAAEQLKLDEEARVREAAAAEQLKLEEEARAREAAVPQSNIMPDEPVGTGSDNEERFEDDAHRLAVYDALRRKMEEDTRPIPEIETASQAVDDAIFQDDDRGFRLEMQTLRRAAEDLARKRAENDMARRIAEEEERRRNEEDVRRVTEENSKRQSEEAQRQAEREDRIRAEEEVRQRARAAEARREAELAEHRRIEEERRAEIVRAEEEARIFAEEESRRLALQQAEDIRRVAEDEARRAMEMARERALEEARRVAQEETRLAVEAARQRAVDEARRVAEEEARRLTEQANAWRQQSEALLREAKERRRIEEQQFLAEQEALKNATDDLARRRHEVEAARKKAEEEAQFLILAQERIRAEEEARRRTEEERQRSEAEARNRAEEERQRFEEARRRAIEEQKRIEEETRRQAEEEQHRLAELESLKKQAQEQLRQRTEQQLRIREEIEALYRAEEEQRQRIEAATRRRTEVEARLREEKIRLQAEEEARSKAEREAHLAEQARLEAQREAQRRMEEEARARAELEARIQAEEEARRRAAEEEQQRAEREARIQSEAEVQRKIAEEARLRSEQEMLQRATDEERLRETEEPGKREDSDLRLNEPSAQAFVPHSDTEVIQVNPTQLSGNSSTGFVSTTNEAAPTKEMTNKQSDASTEGSVTQQTERTEQPTLTPTQLERFQKGSPAERASLLKEFAKLGGEDVFRLVTEAFDDQSTDVRNAAALALYDFQTNRAASFTRALREGSPDRRRKIGQALAASGLAAQAIRNLTGESPEKTYDSFSLLFLMAKAGEVQPLMAAIEDDADLEVRLAVVKLLALSGQVEIVPAFRRLAVRGSLPAEVRSAIMEAIYQISSQSKETAA